MIAAPGSFWTRLLLKKTWDFFLVYLVLSLNLYECPMKHPDNCINPKVPTFAENVHAMWWDGWYRNTDNENNLQQQHIYIYNNSGESNLTNEYNKGLSTRIVTARDRFSRFFCVI